MPIYEFYCADCHRVYSFLSRRVNTEKRPACPVCARPDLIRRVSSFAISRARKGEEPSAEAMPDVDPERLEKAMEAFAAEGETLNEEDPRQAAHMMRRLFSAAGMPLNAGLEEALRRMEAGEDPDRIEEEMGDLLEADPFAGPGGAAGKGVKGLRRLLPPSVDPTLYEL